MQNGIVTVAYIGATILFILALGGLSHPESSRRGNLYGMLGMGIAVLATVLGIVSGNHGVMLVGMLIGGVIGALLSKKVEKTQMSAMSQHMPLARFAINKQPPRLSRR